MRYPVTRISLRQFSAALAVPALLSIDLSLPVAAQSVLMEEIVVEAQRREEFVQDVPISVSAYNADQLKILQVTESINLGQLSPNTIGHNNTGPGTSLNYAIRSLNNTESIATFDPPVGSYIDDVFVQRQNANNFQFFDIDRVEILRGPQGTLFGRNTTGGAVVVRMKKPSDQFGAYAEAGYGDYDRIELRGGFDAPVTDKILTKVSAFWLEDDGFVDNQTTGDTLNSQEAKGIRGDLRILLTDDLTWDTSLSYVEDDHSNILHTKQNSSRVAATGITEGGSPLVAANAIVSGDKQNFGLGNEIEDLGFSTQFDWATDAGTASLIIGYRELEQEFLLDFVNAPTLVGGFSIANDGEHEQTSVEAKWVSQMFDGAVEYVAGLYYFDEDNTTDFADIIPIALAPDGTCLFCVTADRVMDNTTESYAAYAQADWHFIDKWTATVGIRYTDEEKDIEYVDNTGGNLNTADIVALGLPVDQDTDLWTPRFAVKWAPTDDQMYYASATRGFKSGGWNARGGTPEAIQPFSKETVWSYEVGGKSTWFDNTVLFNWAAFYMDVTDFQLPSATTGPNGGQLFITRNFADLEVKGLEIQTIWNPLDALSLWLNLGWMDSEYENLSPEVQAQQQDCIQNGNNCFRGIVAADGSIADPVRSPDYTVTAGASYTWPITSSMDLVPSGYIYSVGEHSVFTSGYEVDGYTTFNASLALNHNDQQWSLIAECRNCNDRTMVTSFFVGEYFQDPRTWMVRFLKEFGAR